MDVYVDNVAPQTPSLSSVTAASTNQIDLAWAIPLDQGCGVVPGATEYASTGGDNAYRCGNVGVSVRRNGTVIYGWGTGTSASDCYSFAEHVLRLRHCRQRQQQPSARCVEQRHQLRRDGHAMDTVGRASLSNVTCNRTVGARRPRRTSRSLLSEASARASSITISTPGTRADSRVHGVRILLGVRSAHGKRNIGGRLVSARSKHQRAGSSQRHA